MSTAVQKPQKTAELADQMEEVEDINDIDLPMRIPNIPMMTPGRWNGIQWTADEIEMALENTTFESQLENEGEIEQNNALFFEHDDRDARAWIGEVENIRMEDVEGEGRGVVGDLVIVDEDAAKKLAYGAKFGISAKVSGRTDGDVMRNFSFENFSLVLNPAVKTTFINSEMENMILQDLEVHEPEFDSTDEREWNAPDLEDFKQAMNVDAEEWSDMTEEQRTSVSNHFIVSKSGFPAENFTDLGLPVVEPDGTLNLNALQNAKARAGQVEGLTGEDLERAVQIINRLANENFEDANFEPVENSSEEEESNDDEQDEDSVENEDENDTMGDNTPMTEDDVEPETDSPEDGDEVEESAESVDMESLKDELLSELKEELQEDEESEDDVEDEDVEDDVEEDEVENEELSEFEEFLNENPDLSPKEAAEQFEEAQKTPEEKAEEKIADVKQEMASHIEDLKSEIEELSESEPARVSKASGQTYEELSEKVQEQDRSELRKGVMRKMLDQAGASHLYK